MQRLFDVAKNTRGITRVGQLASFLNFSLANVDAWTKRGVSKNGALRAQEKFNCSAYWILTGEGDRKNIDTMQAYDSLTQEMIELMQSSDERGKQKMFIAAQDALQAHFAWLESLPKPINNDLDGFIRDRAEVARERLFNKINERAPKCDKNYHSDY